MTEHHHTINDFKIGESVVPVNQKEFIFVVVDIDVKAEKVICRLAQDVERIQYTFEPGELEKESYMRPHNIVN